MTCSVCLGQFHLSCLPNLNQDDSAYAYNDWICIKCCEDIFPFNCLEDDSEF